VAALTFDKLEGLGNDFVVIDARASGELMSAARAVALCDRHRGIGADGVISLLPSRVPEARLRMHLYNADGSVAEMCGNGLRCVIRAVLGEEPSEKIWVDTDAGLRSGEALGGGRFRVSLGQPKILSERLSVRAEGRDFSGTWVSMGNPHFVVDLLEEAPLPLAERYGPLLERASVFPERSNIELFRKKAGGGLELVVFERGAGLTQACGTGAGATVVAAQRRGWVPPGPVEVELPGGALRVELRSEGVLIEGPARHVFQGRVDGPR
jgi:diaminopimelate epimerase